MRITELQERRELAVTQCVLFDLDGTLIESHALYATCAQAALTAEFGSSPPFKDLVSKTRPISERMFLIDWLGEEVGARVHGRLCDVYEACAADLLGGLYAGVAELLQGLRASGVPMGIVSGKSRRAFAATRESMKELDLFDVVILEDDVSAPKPDPEGLLLALSAFGMPATNAVYVGDTHADVDAAKRAGMVGAFALWSHSDEERQQITESLAPNVWRLHAPTELAARLLP